VRVEQLRYDGNAATGTPRRYLVAWLRRQGTCLQSGLQVPSTVCQLRAAVYLPLPLIGIRTNDSTWHLSQPFQSVLSSQSDFQYTTALDISFRQNATVWTPLDARLVICPWSDGCSWRHTPAPPQSLLGGSGRPLTVDFSPDTAPQWGVSKAAAPTPNYHPVPHGPSLLQAIRVESRAKSCVSYELYHL
jgi:hypothetical protein